MDGNSSTNVGMDVDANAANANASVSANTNTNGRSSVEGSVKEGEGAVGGCTQLPDCPCGCQDKDADCMFDSMPDEELLYDLADLFKVFADTTRIKILYALMGHDRCVADISEIINATQSAVSHQLRILKQAHLVKFKRDGKNVIYSLADDHVYTMLAQGLTHICE